MTTNFFESIPEVFFEKFHFSKSERELIQQYWSNGINYIDLFFFIESITLHKKEKQTLILNPSNTDEISCKINTTSLTVTKAYSDSSELADQSIIENTCQGLDTFSSMLLFNFPAIKSGYATDIINDTTASLSKRLYELSIPVAGGKTQFNHTTNNIPLASFMAISKKNESGKNTLPDRGSIILAGNLKTIDQNSLDHYLLHRYWFGTNPGVDKSFIGKQLNNAIKDITETHPVQCLYISDNIVYHISSLSKNESYAFNITDISYLTSYGECVLIFLPVEQSKAVSDILSIWDIRNTTIGTFNKGSDTLVLHYAIKNFTELPNQFIQDNKEVKHQKGFNKDNFNLNELREGIHIKELTMQLSENVNICSKIKIREQFENSVRNNFPGNELVGKCPIILDSDYLKKYISNIQYPLTGFDQNSMVDASFFRAMYQIICSGYSPSHICSDIIYFNTTFVDEAILMNKRLVELSSFFNLKPINLKTTFIENLCDPEVIELSSAPILGILGTSAYHNEPTPYFFNKKGDIIFLIGETTDSLETSELVHHIFEKQPECEFAFDLEKEMKKLSCITTVTERKLVNSAQSISRGGLYFALLECALHKRLGFDITTDAEFQKETYLFSELGNRVIVTVSSEKESDFIDFMIDSGITFTALGHVTKDEIRIDDISLGFIDDIRKIYNKTLLETFLNYKH